MAQETRAECVTCTFAKYPNKFSRQMEAIIFTIHQIFLETRACLTIDGYHKDIPQYSLGDIQSRDAFRPMARKRILSMDYDTT